MFRVKKTGNHKTLEKTQTYFWFQVKDIKISNIFYKIQKIKKKSMGFSTSLSGCRQPLLLECCIP